MSGAYRDEHEEAIERRESMHDREYLDEQRADRAAERAPLPDPPRTSVVRPDIAILREARKTLTRMAAGYRESAYDGQDPDAVRCASYAETACDHAEEAIFGVLNTLSNYLDDGDAATVIEDVLALPEASAS